jgi:hypothetical protein
MTCMRKQSGAYFSLLISLHFCYPQIYELMDVPVDLPSVKSKGRLFYISLSILSSKIVNHYCS